MNEDGFEKELCSVCGDTFRGARSHKDKPYKTCKNCLDSEDIGRNRTKHLMDRMDSLTNNNENKFISNNGIGKEIIDTFNETKTLIDNILNIDSVFEVNELEHYYKASFLNVAFNRCLNEKILLENNLCIFTRDTDNGLEISLRK